MDIAITLALLVIAVCLLFGKPVQITILHKYDNPPLPGPDEAAQLKEQVDEQSETIKSMDAVIKSLNEMMGVVTNANDNRPT